MNNNNAQTCHFRECVFNEVKMKVHQDITTGFDQKYFASLGVGAHS